MGRRPRRNELFDGRMTPSCEDRINWRAAVWLGLVSSTYSTLVSTLFGARVGRDVLVDWMIVAAIPFRDPALFVHPPWHVILGGVLFHQWADFSWAVVFFAVLGRWTERLAPSALVVFAAAWALFTSSLEWLFLVPLVPFFQPIFTLEQVYWLGLFVHLSSAAVYPIYPWIHDRVSGRHASRHRRFAAAWSIAGLALLATLCVIAAFGMSGREIPWQGDDPRRDQAFMREMAAHHTQGIALAELGATRARDPHLRALARMMGAAQLGEIGIFRQWWRSWFAGSLPPASAAEHLRMPGMLTPGQFATVQHAPAATVDRQFVAAMTFHHRGAILMADGALRQRGDPRIRMMAHAIRHEQTGEIALMHGIRPGWRVVQIGLSSLVAPPRGRPGVTVASDSGRR
jgi:uncharacterized protein (DUF305 family)